MANLKEVIGLAILRKNVINELDLEDVGGAIKQGAKNVGKFWGGEGAGGKAIKKIAKTTKEFYGEKGAGGSKLRAAGRALLGKERESKLSIGGHLKKGASMLAQQAKEKAEEIGTKHAGKVGAGAAAAGLGAAALAGRKKKM